MNTSDPMVEWSMRCFNVVELMVLASQENGSSREQARGLVDIAGERANAWSPYPIPEWALECMKTVFDMMWPEEVK